MEVDIIHSFIQSNSNTHKEEKKIILKKQKKKKKKKQPKKHFSMRFTKQFRNRKKKPFDNTIQIT